MNINVVWMGDLNDWEIGNCRKQLQQSSGKLIPTEFIEVWILSFHVFAHRILVSVGQTLCYRARKENVIVLDILFRFLAFANDENNIWLIDYGVFYDKFP